MGCYTVYTDEQIVKFVNLVNNGMSQRKAVEKMHIKQRTASNHYQIYRAEEHRKIPESSKQKKKAGRKPRIQRRTYKASCKVYGKGPTAVLKDIQSDL